MQRAEWRFRVLTVAGTLLLASCHLGQSSKSDDKVITTVIQSKFFQDPALKGRDIHVISEQGMVVLSGSVESDVEKASAERWARQVHGVKGVVNELVTSAQATAPLPPAAPPPSTASNPPPARAVQASSLRRSRPKRLDEDAAPKPVFSVATPAPAEAPAAHPSRLPITDPPEAAPAPKPTPAPTPDERAPTQVTVPAGTVITVRLIDSIDSSRNHPGDEFTATVDSPVVVGNQVVIPKNSGARVRLVEAKSAGHMTGHSELEVELSKVDVGNSSYPVETSVRKQEGASRGKRTAETVGGGAGLGALIGAIAGKGKGAAIGAAIGAGAGAAAQGATRGQQVKISSESKLDFTLKTPIAVTVTGP